MIGWPGLLVVAGLVQLWKKRRDRMARPSGPEGVEEHELQPVTPSGPEDVEEHGPENVAVGLEAVTPLGPEDLEPENVASGLEAVTPLGPLDAQEHERGAGDI